jgi:hypothetical protein
MPNRRPPRRRPCVTRVGRLVATTALRQDATSRAPGTVARQAGGRRNGTPAGAGPAGAGGREMGDQTGTIVPSSMTHL